MDRRLKDVKLAKEARRDRQSQEREQIEAQCCCRDWLALPQPRVVVQVEALFARAAQVRHDGERAPRRPRRSGARHRLV